MNATTAATSSPGASSFVLDRTGLSRLFDVLAGRGYQVVGPAARGGAIGLEPLKSADDLPAGFEDEQKPGSYRLVRREDGRLFGHTAGPHSWKRFLFPPRIQLWKASRKGADFSIDEERAAPVPLAFLGVRACELAAIRIQDRILDGFDATYSERRANLFIVAVTCGRAGGTCFCASMGTGPEPGPGFDVGLTEILDETRHVFVGVAGTEKGRSVLEEIAPAPASPADIEEAAEAPRRARLGMGRRLETNGLKEILYRNYEHPRWSVIAQRCLTCSNCALVCPTCFCHTVEDTTDLTGSHAARWRTWDSCFTTAFSRVAGGNTRPSSRARFRQWMMHKLATWIDQFGTPGCVGCGRCITWCPARIDLTEEASFFRMNETGDSSRKPEMPAVVSGEP